jgi:hypothetical protein
MDVKRSTRAHRCFSDSFSDCYHSAQLAPVHAVRAWSACCILLQIRLWFPRCTQAAVPCFSINGFVCPKGIIQPPSSSASNIFRSEAPNPAPHCRTHDQSEMASAMLESNVPGEGVYEKIMSQDKKRVVRYQRSESPLLNLKSLTTLSSLVLLL